MKRRWIVAAATGMAAAVSLGLVALAQTVSTDVYAPGGAVKYQFADPAFGRLWSRTDRVYAEQKASRTWFWGPGPDSIGILEPYKEDPLDRGAHLVQYYDKSRMEINNPKGDRNDPFFVTNGLLTIELISGQIQVGQDSFVQSSPACIPMAGDFGNNLAPTYADFGSVSNTRLGNHPAPNRLGQRPTETMSQGAKMGTDPSKASMPGTDFVYFEPKTNHNIPAVIWDFLNGNGPIYDESGKLVTGRLMNPWYFASGLPISEPYWTKAPIKGQVVDVMIQAYERVVFTYVPTNIPGWKVEYGNIGLHYFDWRYRGMGVCAGATANPVMVPTPAGTPVVLPTDTPVPTATRPPQPTDTPVPQATNTPVQVVVSTSTPVPPTHTQVAVLTRTSTPTPTHEVVRNPPTFTPTSTHTNTPTNIPTNTSTPTFTSTTIPTRTPTYTATPSNTPTRAVCDDPPCNTPTPVMTDVPEHQHSAAPQR